MANSFVGTVWKIDTAFAQAAHGIRSLKIKKIVWTPGAAGQALVINDANGDEIFSATSIAAGSPGIETLDMADGKWFDGLAVATIEGGSCYVYLA